MDRRPPHDRATTRDRAAARDAAGRPPGAGLTRRERRVRAILLAELERLSQGRGLRYDERRKLLNTLDHTFIRDELAKLRRRARTVPAWTAALLALLAVTLAALLLPDLAGGTLGASDLLALLLLAPASGVPLLQRTALRRKVWIYEALYALSDAEDEGVQLTDAVTKADLLLDRIVAAEDAGAARSPLRRLRA